MSTRRTKAASWTLFRKEMWHQNTLWGYLMHQDFTSLRHQTSYNNPLKQKEKTFFSILIWAWAVDSLWFCESTTHFWFISGKYLLSTDTFNLIMMNLKFKSYLLWQSLLSCCFCNSQSLEIEHKGIACLRISNFKHGSIDHTEMYKRKQIQIPAVISSTGTTFAFFHVTVPCLHPSHLSAVWMLLPFKIS